MPGVVHPVFRLHAGHRMAAAICYDVGFPAVFRDAMRDAVGPPDFFIACGSEQADETRCLQQNMLRMSQKRAVKRRRPVVRSTAHGYSAVIGACGVIRKQATSLDLESSWHVGTVPLDARGSLYVQLGDLLRFARAGVSVVRGSVVES